MSKSQLSVDHCANSGLCLTGDSIFASFLSVSYQLSVVICVLGLSISLSGRDLVRIGCESWIVAYIRRPLGGNVNWLVPLVGKSVDINSFCNELCS